jgi:hypothetical protein
MLDARSRFIFRDSHDFRRIHDQVRHQGDLMSNITEQLGAKKCDGDLASRINNLMTASKQGTRDLKAGLVTPEESLASLRELEEQARRLRADLSAWAYNIHGRRMKF